ncbi:hypothetical protein HKX48_004402 [Thoreauomyces humboldtii]|nr:hypothetical protein HKX48_004402 [Thoreauomyces humboldtii]
MTNYPYDEADSVRAYIETLHKDSWWQGLRGSVLAVGLVGLIPTVFLAHVLARNRSLWTPSNLLSLNECVGCILTQVCHVLFLVPQYFPSLLYTSAGGSTVSKSPGCAAQGFLLMVANLVTNQSALALCRERRARIITGDQTVLRTAKIQVALSWLMGVVAACTPYMAVTPYSMQPAMFFCLPDYYARNKQTYFFLCLALLAVIGFTAETFSTYYMIFNKLRSTQREMAAAWAASASRIGPEDSSAMESEIPPLRSVGDYQSNLAAAESGASKDQRMSTRQAHKEANRQLNQPHLKLATRLEMEVIRRGIPLTIHIISAFSNYEIAPWFSALEALCMVINAGLHGSMILTMDLPIRKAALTTLGMTAPTKSPSQILHAAVKPSAPDTTHPGWRSVDPGSMPASEQYDLDDDNDDDDDDDDDRSGDGRIDDHDHTDSDDENRDPATTTTTTDPEMGVGVGVGVGSGVEAGRRPSSRRKRSAGSTNQQARMAFRPGGGDGFGLNMEGIVDMEVERGLPGHVQVRKTKEMDEHERSPV